MTYQIQQLMMSAPGTTPQWTVIGTMDTEEEAQAEMNRRPYPDNNRLRIVKCEVL